MPGYKFMVLQIMTIINIIQHVAEENFKLVYTSYPINSKLVLK